MRILGIDYGSKRIGIAICDELEIAAHTLTTISRKNRKKDIEAIADIVRTYSVGAIVIGYPVRLNGSQGIQCEKINRFAKHLETTCSIPVIKYDESFSTKQAEDILSQSQVKGHKRRKVIDKLAASIILQGYLDIRKREK